MRRALVKDRASPTRLIRVVLAICRKKQIASLLKDISNMTGEVSSKRGKSKKPN